MPSGVSQSCSNQFDVISFVSLLNSQVFKVSSVQTNVTNSGKAYPPWFSNSSVFSTFEKPLRKSGCRSSKHSADQGDPTRPSYKAPICMPAVAQNLSLEAIQIWPWHIKKLGVIKSSTLSAVYLKLSLSSARYIRNSENYQKSPENHQYMICL